MQYRNILCLLILLISGCAGTGTSHSEVGRVTFEVQDKSYDEVWRAMVNVTSRMLTVIANDKAEGTLKARRGVVLGPWGDVISFSIRPASNGAPAYTVEILSLDHPDIPLAGQDWVNTVVYRIKGELEQ